MSQIKKILCIIFIVFFSLILGCGIAIGASNNNNLLGTANFSMGGVYNKSGSILSNYKNVLCIDHTSPLSFQKNYNFEVKNIIKIVGNTSTGIKNSQEKQYTDEANGVLNYILSEYKTKIGYANSHSDNDVQLDLWRYITTWKSDIGKKYDNLSNMKMNGNSYNGKSSNKISKAKEYAKNVSKTEKITDKTDKSSINTAIFIDESGNKFLRIGPFNWSFSGTIKSVDVKSDMKKEDTNAKILTYENKEPQYGYKNIKSDKNFYVLLKVNEFENLYGNVTLKATQTIEEKSVKIYFLQNNEGEQNLIVYKNDTKNRDIKEQYKYSPQFTTIKIEKYEDGTNTKLQGAQFGLYKTDSEGELYEIAEATTNENGVIKFSQIPIDNYVLKETKAVEGYKINGTAEVTIGNQTKKYTNLKNIKVKLKKALEENSNYKKDPTSVVKIQVYDKKQEDDDGDIKIIKKDTSTKQRLAGAEFILQNKNTSKYVVANYSEDEETYIYSEETEMEGATAYVTDENGEIFINNLPLGDYTIIETKTPDPTIYQTTVTKDITVQKGTVSENEFEIYNDKGTPPPPDEPTENLINISGYVWEDLKDGKDNLFNNLYYEKGQSYGDGTTISEDELVEGVYVQLIEVNTGNVVTDKSGEPCTAITGKDGKYIFYGINKDNLSNYYVRFTYNGLMYEAISYENKENLNLENSSKVAETLENRTVFNEIFTEITGTENRDEAKGYAVSKDGQKIDLEYDTLTEAHKALFKNTDKYTISASTINSEYDLVSHYTEGNTELENVNLGLVKRQDADVAIASDIDNVKVSINGYTHTYTYGEREAYIHEGDDEFGEYDGFNVGVKFGESAYKKTYERTVYQSDYEYNATNASNELAVSVTYVITLKNQSTELIAKINELANYASNEYGEISSSKIKYSSDGQSVEEELVWNKTSKYGISYSDENYTAYYTDLSKVSINPNKIVRMYVTFNLSKDNIKGILSDNGVEIENPKALNNIVEINSYSSYKDNNVYAAIDKDSAPGNIVSIPNLLENENKGEDDTDLAPGFQLKTNNARKVIGTVFEDETIKNADETRSGNGIYDTTESGIKGINIVMRATEAGTGAEIVYGANGEIVTDENGNYEISGFIPGEYTIEYTWGQKYNEKYNLVDYKGTVYVNSDRQNSKDWYKNDVDMRYSDAMDDYEMRKNIDAKTANVTSQTDVDKIKQEEIIISRTPTFKINIEYGDDELQTSSNGDKFEYTIPNVDFGIALRAEQAIQLSTKITNITVPLQNGQILMNATANRTINTANDSESIELDGATSGVKYLPESAVTPNGEFDLEIDKELMYGTTLKVAYKMEAKNIGEKDYAEENYYKYGIVSDPSTLIKITPTTVINYVDNSLVFDGNINNAWQIVDKSELPNIVKPELVTKSDGTAGPLATYNTVIKTDSLSNRALAPSESNETTLLLTKLLSTEEQLSYDNNIELIQYGKNGGRTTVAIPGNYVPTALATFASGEIAPMEIDSDLAESLIVTAPTGGKDYVYQYIILGFICLTILGVSIVVIKKIVL